MRVFILMITLAILTQTGVARADTATDLSFQTAQLVEKLNNTLTLESAEQLQALQLYKEEAESLFTKINELLAQGEKYDSTEIQNCLRFTALREEYLLRQS